MEVGMNKKKVLVLMLFLSIATFVTTIGINIKRGIDESNREKQRQIEKILEESRMQEEEDERENQALLEIQNKVLPKYKNYEAVEIVLKNKHQDWTDIEGHFTYNFTNKYSEGLDFLKGLEVDDVKRDTTYLDPEIDWVDTDHPVYIITIKGKRYRYYLKYIYKKEDIGGLRATLIDDIKVIDIVDLDNNDENVIHGVRMTKNDAERLLKDMLFEYNGEAGLTKHFRDKYNYMDGLFDRKGVPLKHERFDGLLVQKFRMIIGKGDNSYLDYSNRVLKDVSILDVYRELVEHYDIYFMLDKDGYLDDYNMVLVKQEDMEIRTQYIKDHPTYSEVTSRLCYKNRNWDGLPITQNFRDKYNPQDGVLKDIDVDYIEYLCKTDDMLKYPISVHLVGGKIEYYGLEFVLTNNNLINDIIVTKLDTDGNDYTLDEMLQMF